ncbi:serine/threonine-protein kinase pim-1-like isoform X1 [Synchiropus splendidus]|uniref:serine/threonine-protein kinase pim-1-like isoform X1 n=2 Tax=Synchiropus splendidus TaxID=270530 RepID=UPI00237DE045|nr:serine/threonine-protein kinase pim-1-like isoform X1 [Synchiropus splendidus]
MNKDVSRRQTPNDDLSDISVELRLVLREKTSEVDLKRKAVIDLELDKKKPKLSRSPAEELAVSGVDAVKGGSFSEEVSTRKSSVAVITGETGQQRADQVESSMKGQTQEVSVPRKRSRKRKHLVEEPPSEEKQLPEVPNWACTSRARFENRYTVGSIMAKGGFGVVCAGWRKADNIPVAIKFVDRCQAEYTKILIRGQEWKINEEVAMTARAADGQPQPFVIGLMDFYDLETDAVLILERPRDMVDLNDFIRERGNCLTEELTRVIMRQMVDAAAHILGNGVFHRDIKEHNILIQANMAAPRIRIIDFSCSCFVSEEPYDAKSFAGTPSLAPPEVILSEVYKAGPTTVWQLGALMWQLTSLYRGFSTLKFLAKTLPHVGLLSKYAEDFLRICLLRDEDKRPTVEQLQHHPWLSY